MKKILVVAVIALATAFFALSCIKTNSNDQTLPRKQQEITKGMTKDDVVKGLGRPSAWFTLRSNGQMTVVSFFTNIPPTPMPENEAWLFEYEKGQNGQKLCVVLIRDLVEEVMDDSCTKKQITP